MKKNGFTLVELLAVIILLSLIALVAFPTIESIVKNGKQDLYDSQIKNIYLSLKDWATSNPMMLPEKENDIVTLTLGQLKTAGFVEYNVKNPKTKSCFPNDMILKITKKKQNYIYEVLENTGTLNTNCDVVNGAPTIVLNGEIEEYVEYKSNYIEKGALAKSIEGIDISDKIVVTKSEEIDTSLFKTYTITYTVEDNNETSSITRKVIIRDTTPPILNIPADITINKDETTLNIMEGVSATDNNGEEVKITTSHNLTLGIPGVYRITYIATDSKGNETSKVRKVIIGKDPNYQDTILNGADPEIGTGMIPVTIDDDGTVKKADVTKAWYNYQDKKWANVVTVTSETRSEYKFAPAGTTIIEADILTYLVWIPRYKYQLWNVNGDSSGSKTAPFTIQITFENKDTPKSSGTTNGSWLTHPSFTFLNEELNGYWVGKFDAGYHGAETTSAAEVNANDSSKIVTKPNTYSWRGITVSNAFFTVQGMKNSGNVFGLSTTADSHMMKNMEWGAVAYLSHSKYGTNKQVRINNNSQYVTGCAASTEDAGEYNGCQNAWNTSIGYLASTTGNITGIYDMSGGAWEYVMGYTTGASTQYGLSGFTSSNFPSNKYVDMYTGSATTDYANGKLGDATKELGPFTSSQGAWYQDFDNFVRSDAPWFVRNGGFPDVQFAGIFYFNGGTGDAWSGYSFRIVILGK